MFKLDTPFNPGDGHPGEGPYTHMKKCSLREYESGMVAIAYLMGTVDEQGEFIPGTYPPHTESFSGDDADEYFNHDVVSRATNRAAGDSAAYACLARRVSGAPV